MELLRCEMLSTVVAEVVAWSLNSLVVGHVTVILELFCYVLRIPDDAYTTLGQFLIVC